MSDELISGLLRERDHCERRGLPGRVEQIDRELARLGHKTEAKETAAVPAPSNEPKFHCDKCDFEAASKAGLGAHRRKHNSK